MKKYRVKLNKYGNYNIQHNFLWFWINVTYEDCSYSGYYKTYYTYEHEYQALKKIVELTQQETLKNQRIQNAKNYKPREYTIQEIIDKFAEDFI